ncbi:hypothetical protein [Sulfuricurvum sp.]|uniref:hypothetical protein n=1 Tax=Sulfuricurvum sp. TaxID=2025608 RepID=UPI003BB63DD4
MSVISQGFDTFFRIREVGTIKPGGSGTMEGRSYAASVKFRSQIVFTKNDPRVGMQEVEINIEVKIPCDDEDQAVKVTELVRKLRTNKTPFFISGDLPLTHDNGKKKDVYNVTSFDLGSDFIKNHASVPSLKAS